MKLINSSNVTHIVVNKETEGIETCHGGFVKRVYMEAEYFHFLWFFKTSLKNYEEGFYRDCKRKWISNDTPFEINNKKQFIRDNSVWTFPFIQVFCGKDIIHTEYFKTYQELEQHVKDNYNHCTIKY